MNDQTNLNAEQQSYTNTKITIKIKKEIMLSVFTFSCVHHDYGTKVVSLHLRHHPSKSKTQSLYHNYMKTDKNMLTVNFKTRQV